MSSLAPLASIAAAGLAYAFGVRRVARWPWSRAALFGGGLAALAAALCVVDAAAERRLPAHMVQHALLTVVAPPLLCAGAPVRLALGAARGGARRRLARVLHSAPVRALAHPLAGWLGFSGVLLALHLTGLFAAALRHPLLHEAEHAALLAGALVFWAPVVGADPLPRRPGAAGRVAWLLAAMPAMGLVGAWLLTGPQRYAGYGLADQRTAASAMWVSGSLALAGAIVVLGGAALWREERTQRRREAAADRPGGTARPVRAAKGRP